MTNVCQLLALRLASIDPRRFARRVPELGHDLGVGRAVQGAFDVAAIDSLVPHMFFRGMFRAPDKPPPGWWVSDGTLQPDLTIAGHFARLEEVKGVCHTRDCRRRCEVDLRRLCERGFGALPITEAQRFLKCLRFDGCALDFHTEGRVSLPLSALVGRSHVRIRIRCDGCRFHRVTTPEALIAKLTKDGVHGSDVLLSQIAGHVKGPCGQCGKTAWRADVLWPDPNSEGWRRARQAPDRNA